MFAAYGSAKWIIGRSSEPFASSQFADSLLILEEALTLIHSPEQVFFSVILTITILVDGLAYKDVC